MLDLSPRNLVFSLKLAASAVLSLAAAYLLELDQPQWAVITAILVAQPLAGAAVAKGIYRLAGTVAGGLFGLLAIGLFVQVGPPFVAVTALWLGACTYGVAVTRNYPSYGFALAAYTGVLIAFEGTVDPASAWLIAVDRVTEVGLGILCTTAVSATIFPQHAGDVLRDAVDKTVRGLSGYAAAALRPGMSDDAFVRLRNRMLADVMRFDQLRSYAVFDTPGLHADDDSLRRMARELLRLLSVARGLYQRLDELRKAEDARLHDRLDPALATAAATFQRLADDPAALAEPRRLRAEFAAARKTLAEAAAALEAEAAAMPLEPLANALLVLRRTSDMIHTLSMVVLAYSVSLGAACGPRRLAPVTRLPPDRRAALAHGLAAAVALVAVGAFWIATAWTAGVTAAWSVAIMMCFFVSVRDPARVGLEYLAGVVAAVLLALPAMVFVMPQLEDFAALAGFLALVLVPTGIAAGSPRTAWFGLAFGAFLAASVGLSNVPDYDIATYVDASTGMVLGMAVGLVAINVILPADPLRPRRQAWARTIAALVPAARGLPSERQAPAAIVIAVGNLLAELDFSTAADEQILRGSFGAASMSLELVRLDHRLDDAALPEPARAAVAGCLAGLADAFERLHDHPRESGPILAEAKALVARTRDVLLALPRGADPATRSVVRALASLRFLADRLDIDRPFLTQEFATG